MKFGRWLGITAVVGGASACAGMAFWDRPYAAPTPGQAPPHRGLQIGDPAPLGLVRPGQTTAVIVAEKCTVSCPYHVLPDKRLTGFDRVLMIRTNVGDEDNYPGADVLSTSAELLTSLDAVVRPKLLVYSKAGRLMFASRESKPWDRIVDDYLASRKTR